GGGGGGRGSPAEPWAGVGGDPPGVDPRGAVRVGDAARLYAGIGEHGDVLERELAVVVDAAARVRADREIAAVLDSEIPHRDTGRIGVEHAADPASVDHRRARPFADERRRRGDVEVAVALAARADRRE